MKILVPIKPVAELDEEFEMLDDDRAVDPDFLEYDLNDWDRYGVEAALQLAQGEDDEVVVATVGDEESDDVLRTCLAMGAGRAVRIWDEDLELTDPLAVGRVLAALIERESPDLVICGAQSSDSAHSTTGIAAAGFAELAHVALVKAIRPTESGALEVKRELENGEVEVGHVSLPVLVTVQTGINSPRYVTLRAVGVARDTPIEVLAPAELGLDEAAIGSAAGAQVTRLRRPDEARRADALEGTPAEIAVAIKGILAEKLG